MLIEILTIFPGLFNFSFEEGIINRAIKKGVIDIKISDLRNFTTDRHRRVDDRPFGGGEGMVLKPEPIFRAVEASRKEYGHRPHVVLLSPKGKQLDQSVSKDLVEKRHLFLICGRYEGVDQRVADYLVDEELSIGDYVLSGGEFAAMVIVDSVCRLIPGALGNKDSTLQESFTTGKLDHPQYTRPAKFRGWCVPPVLLCGDHKKIQKWRKEQAFKETVTKRPDLLVDSQNSNNKE